jgi:hypothetical protein
MKFRLFLLLVPAFISCKENLRHAEIPVSGNCEMCKETIEDALKSSFIYKSAWDPETKILEIDFDESKISLPAIRQKIAAAGYDTDSVKAVDSTYLQLHECCRYRD